MHGKSGPNLDLLALSAPSLLEHGFVLHGALNARVAVNVHAAEIIELCGALVCRRGLWRVLAEVNHLGGRALGCLLPGSIVRSAPNAKGVVVTIVPAHILEILEAWSHRWNR